MNRDSFAKIKAAVDRKEAACHAVFDEAHDVWTFKGRTALNVSQLTVLCVETYFGEVCNGGHLQFLGNESGRNASLAPEALRRVGLSQYATILEDALARSENHPQKNSFGEMDDCFEPTNDDEEQPFDDLDDRFFRCYGCDKSEFRNRLFAYIVAHEDNFVSE